MTIFTLACTWASVCFILLHTDALIEYIQLFRVSRFFFLSDFYELKAFSPKLTYVHFLLEYHNNFFTRLIGCPACLAFWLNLISLAALPYWQFFSCYFFTLIFYFTLVILSKWHN